MATGKELTRLVCCGYWDEVIKKRKDYKSFQIYDSEKRTITPQQAIHKTFCSIRIMFKDCPVKELKLLCIILKLIADTPSESMGVKTSRRFKGYQEVVIS